MAGTSGLPGMEVGVARLKTGELTKSALASEPSWMASMMDRVTSEREVSFVPLDSSLEQEAHP